MPKDQISQRSVEGIYQREALQVRDANALDFPKPKRSELGKRAPSARLFIGDDNNVRALFGLGMTNALWTAFRLSSVNVAQSLAANLRDYLTGLVDTGNLPESAQTVINNINFQGHLSSFVKPPDEGIFTFGVSLISNYFSLDTYDEETQAILNAVANYFRQGGASVETFHVPNALVIGGGAAAAAGKAKRASWVDVFSKRDDGMCSKPYKDMWKLLADDPRQPLASSGHC